MTMVSKEGNGRIKLLLKKIKPYAAMVFLQFSIAVMYVILMASLKEGMNQSVMFAYRSIIATTFLAPFALWFERKGRPKMTLIIFVKVTALGILQPVLDQNCYLLGAKLTSVGFASALENINPAITFFICLLLRMEKLNIRRKQGLVKVIGAMLGVIGAILMILYKGPIVDFFWSKGIKNHGEIATAIDAGNRSRWIWGILIIFISSLSWSSFIILQANTLKSYSAKLSLATMVCSVGAVINSVIALVVKHGSLRPWILGWNLRLFAVIYSGLIGNAFWYFMLGVVMKEKGPVFASAFSPLTMIMTNALSSTFLAENILLGTIIGACILVAGMYFILWGKSMDFTVGLESAKSTEEPELPIVTINNVQDLSTTFRFEPTLTHSQETKQECFPQKDKVVVLD